MPVTSHIQPHMEAVVCRRTATGAQLPTPSLSWWQQSEHVTHHLLAVVPGTQGRLPCTGHCPCPWAMKQGQTGLQLPIVPPTTAHAPGLQQPTVSAQCHEQAMGGRCLTSACCNSLFHHCQEREGAGEPSSSCSAPAVRKAVGADPSL